MPRNKHRESTTKASMVKASPLKISSIYTNYYFTQRMPPEENETSGK